MFVFSSIAQHLFSIASLQNNSGAGGEAALAQLLAREVLVAGIPAEDKITALMLAARAGSAKLMPCWCATGAGWVGGEDRQIDNKSFHTS